MVKFNKGRINLIIDPGRGNTSAFLCRCSSFLADIPVLLMGSHKKMKNFCSCSKPSWTKAPYTYNEATTIAQI